MVEEVDERSALLLLLRVVLFCWLTWGAYLVVAVVVAEGWVVRSGIGSSSTPLSTRRVWLLVERCM